MAWKGYKKYGDIYHTMAQVRANMKNNAYKDSRNELLLWWIEQYEVCMKENKKDCAFGYITMFALAQTFEAIDKIFWWRMVVYSMRQQYK